MPSVPSKRMIRYLEIKPSQIQRSIVNAYNQAGEKTGQKIGYFQQDNNAIERNKYMVRLTSRDTGRKVAVMLNFSKILRPPEE